MKRQVESFSIKPGDKEGLKAVEALKKHAEKTGISFSFLVISAIKEQYKDLSA